MSFRALGASVLPTPLRGARSLQAEAPGSGGDGRGLSTTSVPLHGLPAILRLASAGAAAGYPDVEDCRACRSGAQERVVQCVEDIVKLRAVPELRQLARTVEKLSRELGPMKFACWRHFWWMSTDNGVALSRCCRRQSSGANGCLSFRPLLRWSELPAATVLSPWSALRRLLRLEAWESASKHCRRSTAGRCGLKSEWIRQQLQESFKGSTEDDLGDVFREVISAEPLHRASPNKWRGLT